MTVLAPEGTRTRGRSKTTWLRAMENFQNTEGWSSWNAGKAAPEEHSHPAWRTYAPTGVKKDDDDDDDDRTNYSS